MRTSRLFLVISLLVTPAAAQTPLATATTSVLGPKTIVPAKVACTDIPIGAEPSAPLHILAPHSGDPHELSYRDDLVVLSGGTGQGLQVGQRYFARRFQPPRSGESVSVKDRGSIRTTGWLTVVAADEQSAMARIDYACDGIAASDYLDPYVEPVLPTEVAADGPTNFANLGRVLSGADRRESFGAGDLVSIDRGASHGMAIGTRLAFYRDRLNGTPLVELGTGIVLEVSPETSKVVLDRARFAVTTGDLFGVRQP